MNNQHTNTGIDRRTALTLGLGAVATFSSMATSQENRPMLRTGRVPGQGDGFYRMAMGDIELIVVSDGNLNLPAVHPILGVNATQADVQAELEAVGMGTDGVLTHVTCLVVRTGADTVLIDTGGGANYLPVAGGLIDNLKNAGIAPGDVTKVVITHAHGDHVGGLTTRGSTLAFPNATHVFSKDEASFWQSADIDDLSDMVIPDENKRGLIDGARSSLDVTSRVQATVVDGEEIAPGVRARMAPGHTPGHLAVSIESGGKKAMFVGDAIVHRIVSFSRPDWHFIFDAQPQRAAETRRALLKELADDKVLTIGTHIGFPGVGHVARDGSAFRWTNADWDWARA